MILIFTGITLAIFNILDFSQSKEVKTPTPEFFHCYKLHCTQKHGVDIFSMFVMVNTNEDMSNSLIDTEKYFRKINL